MRWMERIALLFDDRRADVRVPVLVEAEFSADETPVRGILLNLSRSGALMAARSTLAAGDRGRLCFHGITATATVRWTEGYRFGLQFDQSLSRATLDAVAAAAWTPTRAR